MPAWHSPGRLPAVTLARVEEDSYLTDRPPGGWSELVTTPVLDAHLVALRHEIVAQMHREFAALHRELRDQTWRLTTVVIAAMVMGALFGGLVALVGS